MAPSAVQKLTGKMLMDRVKKFRQDECETMKSQEGTADRLEQIHNFLMDHEAVQIADCTHEVLHHYDDWWVGKNCSKKLSIIKDSTLESFYQHMAELFDMGIPMTIGERRTSEFKFLMDLELRGKKDTYLEIDQLISPQSKFFLLLGNCMLELYPAEEKLAVAIFDGSGLNREIGVKQTAIRFVWSGIIVDKARAQKIMDYVVHKLITSEDAEIKALEAQMRSLHDENQWKHAFVDKIYCGQQPIRMPLNDSVAPPPMIAPELRALKPHCIFHFLKTSQTPEVVYNHQDPGQEGPLPGDFLLGISCIRLPSGTPLTDWSPPTWKGEQNPRRYFEGVIKQEGGPSRSSGQVKGARTFGGSGDEIRRVGGGNRGAGGMNYGDRSKQDEKKTYTRQFEGSLEDFQEKLNVCLGDTGKSAVDDQQGIIKWTPTMDTGATIEFRSKTRRVYFTGQDNQVRSLLEAMAVYVNPVDDTATIAASVAGRASTRMNGGYAGSVAPSQAFQPRGSVSGGSIAGRTKPTSLAAGASRATRTGEASSQKARSAAREVPYNRIVTQDFEAEAQGELSLSAGQQVIVTQDEVTNEEDAATKVDRWVYGHVTGSTVSGYFPISFTKAAD